MELLERKNKFSISTLHRYTFYFWKFSTIIFYIWCSIEKRIFDLLLLVVSHSMKLKIYFGLHYYLKEHYEKYNVKKMLEKSEAKRKQKSRTFTSLLTNMIEVSFDSFLLLFLFFFSITQYSKRSFLKIKILLILI